MAVDFRFKFPLPNGLHARPASHFEAVTSRFRSKITLIHERTLVKANTRSVLSMVSADVKYDDPCCIHVDGDDEEPALDAVRRFLKDELPHCDEALPQVRVEQTDLVLPRSLSAAGLKQYVRGRAVCGGVGIGRVVIIGGLSVPAGIENERATNPAHEQQRVTNAIELVSASLQSKIDAAVQRTEIQVLKAHSAIVRDVALIEMINSLIIASQRTAAQAIVQACKNFTETLRQSDSSYLRERVLDVEDICMQLLDRVTGVAQKNAVTVLTEPSVCIADHLTPGQLLGLNREYLKGLVMSEGGVTSHTVILARSMNIPTLVGVPQATISMPAGCDAVVDGELGLLATELSVTVQRYYAMELNRLNHRRQILDSYRLLDGITGDGHPLEVGANIASAEESAVAFANGAQGIGLFRTEMLFMDRESAPSEQEQVQIYTAAVSAAGGKPVIIRLLDIGGDKPAPYLNLPAEDNPFLGFRGARLYGEFSDLVKNQLRAILQASTTGNVKILVPMICCLEEVRDIRRLLDQCVTELKESGKTIQSVPQLGAMVEIPSLAFLMPEMCRELDFFSIGSNDLTQYFLAADRANQKVASLYTWSHPAFLRMLKSIVDQAKSFGKWIGLCGELGDQPAALPLLVALGLNEISVSPPRVNNVKAAIGRLLFSHCSKLLEQALLCSTREEVELLVQRDAERENVAPLITADLIFTSDAESKEEVIKQMADRLFLADRVVKPQLLEEAIWNREDTYSTGFGYGFALPHCKSDHLDANSIVIAKLKKPVEWGSLDQKPVDVAILLAIRGQDPDRQHMKIFARLSRLVMRDEFRDALRAEADPAILVKILSTHLGLGIPKA